MNTNKLTFQPKLRFRTIYCIITLSVFACYDTFSQAGFSIPDTICIDDSVIIENNSPEAQSYYWNFCSGNLIYDPEGVNIPNPGTLNGPAFIDFANDNNNLFAFITNHTNGTLVRNSFGSNFLNTPVSENLGNFGGALPLHSQGIQVLKDNGNWYVFVVGGQREDSRLVRFEFGADLSNNSPVVTNLGNPNDFLDYPEDLYIINENGNWFGFTVNYNLNTMVRFDFGNSLSNSPSFINLGNIGNFNSPCGILPIRQDGSWHIFVSNFEGHNLSRLDFGSSLTSNPAATIIADAALYYPFDLTIIRDCENTYGFVLNRFNDIVRMVFNEGIANTPAFEPLGQIGSLYNPQGISDVFRVGDTLYTFVCNIDNSSITRLFFPGCNNASPPSSTERNPPPVFYDTPGIYNINLVIDEGLPTQENFCRNIVVLDSADMSLGNDTVIAAGTTIVLQPDSSFSSYQWSTGSTEASIQVNQAGTYLLLVTNRFGCKATDEIEVIIDIGIPNFFTPNGDGYNDTWEIPFLLTEPEAVVSVFDRFGNLLVKYKPVEHSWDGKSNGREMPMGTYWYIIDVPGVSKPYKGSVTIKR